ncbi:glycosyltransferase family 4 protein [Wenzhouxiangella sp. XN79A]|nr:glycosyltransferase family 4 protein [Wenzhouxiangella sp. XN79A]
MSAHAQPRLLVLTSTYPRHSGDKEPAFVHELARRLSESFEVRVIAPARPHAHRVGRLDGVEVRRFRYAPERLQTLAGEGGILANLKSRRWKWLLLPGFFLGLAFTTFQEIRKWRPDVVHAHWLIPQGLVIALLGSISRRVPPFVITSHGGDLFALKRWPFPVLKRFVVRRAAAVTVVSETMKVELIGLGLPEKKISVQPMGVDLEHRFSPSANTERSSKEILFVGRLVEKKGLRFLIDAMPDVLTVCSDAFLTIVGFGPDEEALREQVDRLGLKQNVAFAGGRSHAEIVDFYQRATVFVAPFVQAKSGDQEGLGLVTIEAIGCGCPVIVGDLPATRAVVEDGPFRVPVGSSGRLAQAICEVMEMSSEDRKALAEKQRTYIEGRFDWGRRSNSYASLLRQVSGQRRSD